MAKSNAIWGIDIGQCALKALRCVPSDEPDKITADAFDFIEYPKLLTQPDADPDQLIREAIASFFARNAVKNDSVTVGVNAPGITRFLPLPPVTGAQLPDVVTAEAKQQIPFALDQVVWETQTLPLAIYNFTQIPGGDTQALRLSIISVLLSIAALAVSEIIARRVNRRVKGHDIKH